MVVPPRKLLLPLMQAALPQLARLLALPHEAAETKVLCLLLRWKPALRKA